MSDDSPNPYASPSFQAAAAGAPSSFQGTLADRGTRLAASLIDGILMMGIVFPIYFLTGFWERAIKQQVGTLEMLGMSLMGAIIMLALNGYLLYTRGQTIGKLVLKIQIVDQASDKLLPFLRVYVFRYLWMLPFTIITILIPGLVDDQLVSLVGFIDAAFIFGAARLCLHDRIAGSKVVLFQPNRPRLH